MKIIQIVNSDFGRINTIGARVGYIYEAARDKDDVLIFCRSVSRFYNNLNILSTVPAGAFLMRILTAVPIYLSKHLRTDKIKNRIFEFFLLKKIKKINMAGVKLIHSWEFLPNFYRYIKINFPHIKIVQDVPMAINVIDIKDKNRLFPGESLETLGYVRACFEYIDFFICPSPFVKDSLVRENIDEKKIRTVFFGVDIKSFVPKTSKVDGVFRVCFSGSVNNRKGVTYLIQAWKELGLKNAELNLYGRVYPEVLGILKDKDKCGIHTHGFVDLRHELNKNDVFVFPSLLEGSAKSVYEALACGLPVITTYNAGSVVEDGIEGFIIPIQDVEKIKEKILFFYNSRKEIIDFSKRARKRAEDFSWLKYGKTVNELYESLCV